MYANLECSYDSDIACEIITNDATYTAQNAKIYSRFTRTLNIIGAAEFGFRYANIYIQKPYTNLIMNAGVTNSMRDIVVNASLGANITIDATGQYSFYSSHLYVGNNGFTNINCNAYQACYGTIIYALNGIPQNYSVARSKGTVEFECSNDYRRYVLYLSVSSVMCVGYV